MLLLVLLRKVCSCCGLLVNVCSGHYCSSMRLPFGSLSLFFSQLICRLSTPDRLLMFLFLEIPIFLLVRVHSREFQDLINFVCDWIGSKESLLHTLEFWKPPVRRFSASCHVIPNFGQLALVQLALVLAYRLENRTAWNTGFAPTYTMSTFKRRYLIYQKALASPCLSPTRTPAFDHA